MRQKLPAIHQSKETFRRHFLREWLDERNMGPMDLLRVLNEAADMDSPIIDKSQVYRWVKGQLPQRPTQIRIAAALDLLDPETGKPTPERLMMHPSHDWIARKLRGRTDEELDRARQAIDLVLPAKTGTSH